MALDYHVVIEYTEEAGGYAGNRYITAFDNESEFREWSKDLGKEEKVFAHGVSESEAQKLIDEVPLRTQMNACVDSARNLEILALNLMNLEVAESLKKNRNG